MGAVVVPVLLVVVVLAVGAYAALLLARRGERERLPPDQPTLRYPVPQGQDPAAVLVALRAEGLDAVTDNAGPHPDVVIACPGGVDRERPRVRSIIEHARNLGDEDDVPVPSVRFADEQP